MKLTINTSILQNMVARAMKGASNNKLIPLTGLMAIELKDNTLTIITSDATNYLYVKEDKVVGDDFYVVIGTDIFSKLIARLTCETVTMELTDNALKVTGNGSYSIELPLDENGEMIKYPNPFQSAEWNTSCVSQLSTMKLITTTAKASLSTSLDIPCYTGYYIGDNVVTTDTSQICGVSIKLLDEPALISADTMALLDVLTSEEIKINTNDSHICFITPDCTIYGKMMDSIDDYQIDAITGLLTEQFTSFCSVSKDALLQLLDRLTLFVGVYDKNAVDLVFTSDGLMINSKQANSSEVIKYLESENFQAFSCSIDIEMLRAQVKANSSDAIHIQYGKDNAIKLSSKPVTQIIALLED